MKEKVKVILTVEIEDNYSEDGYIEGILEDGVKIKFSPNEMIRIFSSYSANEGQDNPHFTC